ncbi:hypothetical protein G6F42_018825 [Rhizopus arrhizus]|nr:hypothetical protein G6F42_018825 [Rhizopus arrhizus]
MEKSGLPVLHNRLWIGFQSICLHQSLQAHLGTLALSRLQDFGLLRRLATDRRIKAASSDSSSTGGIFTTRSWMDSELQKNGSGPYTTTGAPRFCLEYPVNDSPPTSSQTEGYSSFYQTCTGQTSPTVSQDHTQFDHADSGSDICHLPSSFVHSSPVVLQESDVDWDHSRPLDPASIKELQWWYVNISKWNGRSMLTSTPNQTMFVDASNTGWGCSWNQQQAHGYWTPEEAAQSINWRELKAAAQLALKTFQPPPNSTKWIPVVTAQDLSSELLPRPAKRSVDPRSTVGQLLMQPAFADQLCQPVTHDAFGNVVDSTAMDITEEFHPDADDSDSEETQE